MGCPAVQGFLLDEPRAQPSWLAAPAAAAAFVPSARNGEETVESLA